MRPRVALAMLTLVPGAMGGTETYARALTRYLDPSRVDATAYVPRGAGGFSGGIDEIEIPEPRKRKAKAAKTAKAAPPAPATPSTADTNA